MEGKNARNPSNWKETTFVSTEDRGHGATEAATQGFPGAIEAEPQTYFGRNHGSQLLQMDDTLRSQDRQHFIQDGEWPGQVGEM